MTWKKFASHAAAFAAGLGLGLLIASKGCPPTPTPGAIPDTENTK